MEKQMAKMLKTAISALALIIIFPGYANYITVFDKATTQIIQDNIKELTETVNQLTEGKTQQKDVKES
jgi:hypothetical protein